MTLIQQSDGNEGASHLATWRKSIPGRGNRIGEDPELGVRTARKLERNGQGGEK